MDALFALAVIGGALAVYFLPCIIAGGRAHPNGTGIFVLNLFLGWSLLGWVVALIWSVSAFNRPVVEAAIIPPEAPARARQRACPHCAEDILSAAKVCKHCGRDVELLERICTNCGDGMPVAANWCPRCKASQASGPKPRAIQSRDVDARGP